MLSRDGLRTEITRLAKAGVVALAVQLVAAGVLVPAIAGGGPTMPEEFSVPEPRAGDRAVYEVSGDARLRGVVATWTAPSWTATPDGDWVRTRALNLSLLAPAPAHDWEWTGHWQGDTWSVTSRNVSLRSILDASTLEPVAWERFQSEVQVWDFVGTEDRNVNKTDRVVVGQTNYTRPKAPLGFLADLHRGPVPTNESVRAGGAAAGSDETRLRAAGVERVRGSPAIRYEGVGSNAAAWYAPNVSFPVKVRAPAARLLPGNASGQPLEWTLTGVDQGPSQPPATGPAPADLPPVPRAPREPWGPARRGFEAPFPVDEAYEALMAEEGPGSASAFARAHPDAYVAEVGLHERHGEWRHCVCNHDGELDVDAPHRETQAWVWRFYLTDGEHSIERFVVRDNESAPLSLAYDDTRVQTRSQTDGTYPEPARHHPDPGEVSARVPAVGAVADQYRRLVDEPGADRWRFEVSCRSPDCRSPRTLLEVGGADKRPRDDERWARSQVETVRDVVGSVVVDGDGRTVEVERWSRTSDDGYESYLQGSGGQARPPSAPAWTSDDLLTLARAAQAGLMATLAGALYYLWPKLKTVGLALYSRIGRDDALDNDTREAILELVREEPGVHFSRLRDELETGAGQLDHHLEVLVDNGLLDEVETPGYRCYFETGTLDPSVKEVADRLRADAARMLLRVVAQRPDASLTDLADELGLSQPGTTYHVDRLEEAGLVDRDRDGRRLKLELTELGRRALEALNLG